MNRGIFYDQGKSSEIPEGILKFWKSLLRSQVQFCDIMEVYQILERSSEISGRVLRSQGVFRDLKLAFWGLRELFLDFRGTSEISEMILRFQRGILRSQGGISELREIIEIQEEPSKISGKVLRYQGGFWDFMKDCEISGRFVRYFDISGRVLREGTLILEMIKISIKLNNLF